MEVETESKMRFPVNSTSKNLEVLNLDSPNERYAVMEKHNCKKETF